MATVETSSAEPEAASEAIGFINNDARITPSPVIQYVLDGDLPYDLVLSCADGKVGAHRLVLVAASPFVGSFFDFYSHRPGEVATIILPDIRLQVMKVILNLCYIGAMVYPNEIQGDVMDAMQMLRIGEHGEFAMSLVTIAPEKVESEAAPESIVDEDNEPEPVPGTSKSALLRSAGAASTGASVNGIRIVEMDLTSTSSSSDADNYNDDDESFHAVSDLDADSDDMDRSDRRVLKLPDEFMYTDKEQELSPYEFLIAPDPLTSEIMYHCYYCPRVYKSLKPLSTHLATIHGIRLEPEQVSKEDLRKIMYCDRCSKYHEQASVITQCLKKQSKTRCYLCLETVTTSQFAAHVKKHKVCAEGTQSFVVTCKWCQAGFVLKTPIDEEIIMKHCFEHHLPKKVKLKHISTCHQDKLPFKKGTKKRRSRAVERKDNGGGDSGCDSDSDSLFERISNKGTKKRSKSIESKDNGGGGGCHSDTDSLFRAVRLQENKKTPKSVDNPDSPNVVSDSDSEMFSLIGRYSSKQVRKIKRAHAASVVSVACGGKKNQEGKGPGEPSSPTVSVPYTPKPNNNNLEIESSSSKTPNNGQIPSVVGSRASVKRKRV